MSPFFSLTKRLKRPAHTDLKSEEYELEGWEEVSTPEGIVSLDTTVC